MDEVKDRALVKLGEKVRELRDRKGISQEELAHLAGLDRTYVGGVERGERNPTILSSLKVSGALGVSLSDLVEGVERE
jgi:transcriptional regulator with XRE-family HTH domain